MTVAKAKSRMLARAVAHYDGLRSLGSSEASARHAAIAEFARLARLDYIPAAERLADFLARRAAALLKNGEWLMEPRKAALREHVINDIELTVINDGNGSQCSLPYLDRLFAGRTHDLMAFVRAASYYNALRVVNECPQANGAEIKEAAERLLAYYENHVREVDET